MSRVTVLIVDDEEPIRFLCEDLLKSVNYDVLTAEDGEKAIEVLKDKGDEVDIVVTDLRMPGIDGIEVTKRVKSDYPEVDVIVLTGFASIESAVESMKIGASDFIRKPFNLNTLLETISRLVEKRKAKGRGKSSDDGSVKETIDAIENAGLRQGLKIMIGGGSVDGQIKNYANADAWGKDAMEAVTLARQWIGGE